MHENNNYNYKKGIEELKKASKFSKWFRSLQIYWIMQRALYIGKAKNLKKKNFFIS